MEICVKKFGGTSVGSIERIEKLADRLCQDRSRGQSPIVVVSAMAGETNRLVELASQISSGRGRSYDLLVSSGEQVSVALLSMALEKRGVPVSPLLGFQLGIRTSALPTKAKILEINKELLRQRVAAGEVPVVAGFQGVDGNQNVTTLGRGGSDTTAIAIAAALGEDSCEIYTDVPAIFSADPRLVPKARELSSISFEEMMEMASLGSKVLHSRCVELAAKYRTRIHLRSTFEEREGTWVVPEGEIMENPVVSAVTHDPSIIVYKLFPVPKGAGFLTELFSKLSESGVVVDIITQSENEEGQRLAFSISAEDESLADQCLKEISEVKKIRDLAKISIVGVGMRTHTGVAARFFQVLSDLDVPVSLVTTSEIKVSAVIGLERLEDVANQLHSAFGLDGL